jgi:hypothetical protein
MHVVRHRSDDVFGFTTQRVILVAEHRYTSGLIDAEVAAVVSYIRNAWGNSATLVAPSEVNSYRTVPLD